MENRSDMKIPAAPAADDRFQQVPQAGTSEMIAVRKRVFIGLILLFSIPVLGWVACAAVAIAAKNRNIQNFARAMLIIILVGAALSYLAYNVVNTFIIDIKWAWGHIIDLAENLADYY